MKIISDILSLFPDKQGIRIKSEGFMDLVVERLGTGPRKLPLVSVAHYYVQNGDMMRDPEMTFEVDGANFWPVSFQQDSLGLYQEACFVGESGATLVRPRLLKDLQKFARSWNMNLRAQGFLKAAKAKAKAIAR
jgi:hypothetical protein